MKNKMNKQSNKMKRAIVGVCDIRCNNHPSVQSPLSAPPLVRLTENWNLSGARKKIKNFPWLSAPFFLFSFIFIGIVLSFSKTFRQKGKFPAPAVPTVRTFSSPGLAPCLDVSGCESCHSILAFSILKLCITCSAPGIGATLEILKI